MAKSDGNLILNGFKVAIILIVAVLVFNTLNQSPAVQSLPNQSKEKVQEIQNNFWFYVALLGIGAIIVAIIWIARSSGVI